MNCETGREFNFTNPQDDPHLYAPPPVGFAYSYDGTLVAVPMTSRPTSNTIYLQNPGIGNTEWLEIDKMFTNVCNQHDCHVNKYSAGPPCGGYYYVVEYKDDSIIGQLEKIGLKASNYAEQLITEGKVKLVVPKTKSNELF